MVTFLVRRLLQGVAVIYIVATLAFVLIRLAPGDPFLSVLDHPQITEEVRQRWREWAGVDRPIAEQYLRFLAGVPRGELGFSHAHQRPVVAVLRDALPNTLVLMTTALVASFVIGIALGVAQARRRGQPADRAVSATTTLLASVPEFWLALVLLLVFAYWVPVFPTGGVVDPVMHDYLSPVGRLVDRLRHLVLPASTLALLNLAAVSRLQRGALLDVLPEDFVRTARAKGVPEPQVLRRHAFRNALIPVITLLGLAVPTLVGGAVFVEGIFSWPGMGLVAIRALAARDYHLVVADVILGSALVVAGGILADLLTARADPRLRTGM